MLSTLPTGAVMFHWQVELNGSKKVPFSSERLSSVANKVTVELWLAVQPEKWNVKFIEISFPVSSK